MCQCRSGQGRFTGGDFRFSAIDGQRALRAIAHQRAQFGSAERNVGLPFW